MATLAASKPTETMLPDILPKKVSLFDKSEDRGISTVIGTAVLIAITLILSGAVGYWALGFGPGKLSGANPGVSLVKGDTEDDPSGDYVLINHNSGPPVEADDIRIVIKDDAGATLMDFESESKDELGVGDTIKINSTATETTVRWGESTTAYSPSSETFDLETEEIEIVFIHSESQAKIGVVTARA